MAVLPVRKREITGLTDHLTEGAGHDTKAQKHINAESAPPIEQVPPLAPLLAVDMTAPDLTVPSLRWEVRGSESVILQ